MATIKEPLPRATAELLRRLMVSPVEIELPPAFRGVDGANRNREPRHPNTIPADDDVAALETWINSKNSSNTRRSYRREGYRLLIWAIYFKGKPLSGLFVEDLEEFIGWMKAPCPHDEWLETWEIVRDPLSNGSILLALTILRVMFNWLAKVGYLAANPFASFDIGPFRKAAQAGAQFRVATRRFDQELWKWLIGFIEKLPRGSAREEHHYQRIRFVIHFAYLTGARRTELVTGKMRDVVFQEENWIWQIRDHGRDRGAVVLGQDEMQVLGDYRAYRGMTRCPDNQNQDAPLVPHLSSNVPIKEWMLNRLLKNFFSLAASEMASIDPTHVAALKHASTSWLRHTMAEHARDKLIPVEVLHARLRHRSMDTTLSGQAHTNRWRQAQEFSRLRTLG